jgi:hypothetical protein|nr:MAG TPA: hypothetical protein [Caudoviricetes sp.]
MIDITRKDLSKQYPVYTKAGNIWKNRIDWNSILKPGTVISTHFGIFTFVSTYKENKVWYIILSDSVNNYTVKRQQARNNKKLPKSVVTQKVAYLSNLNVLDNLISEVTQIRRNFNTKCGKTIKSLTPQSTSFFHRVAYVLDIIGLDKNLYKDYKHQLLHYYHPDKGYENNSDKFLELQQVFNIMEHTVSLCRRGW